MIKETDAEPGDTVYLRPNTKTAGADCVRLAAAILVDAKSEWPIVIVNVPDADQPEGVRTIKVHRIDVGLNPKVVKREKGGDQVGGGEAAPTKVRVMGKPVVNLPDQDVLF